MSRNLIPYLHADISALAKSLKASLAKDPTVGQSHVKLLNALAKANGHQNYQSFQASNILSENSSIGRDAELVIVELPLNHVSEVFRVDEGGRVLDSRRSYQPKRYVMASLQISSGKQSASIGVEATFSTDLAEKFTDFEKSVQPFILQKVLEMIRDKSLNAFGSNTMAFESRHDSNLGQTRELSSRGHIGWMVSSRENSLYIRRVLSQIEVANKSFEEVIGYISSIAFSDNAPEIASRNAEEVRNAAEYLKYFVEQCYVGFLNNWNQEKLPTILRAIHRLSRGEWPESFDLAELRRNIRLFALPNYWLTEPISTALSGNSLVARKV